MNHWTESQLNLGHWRWESPEHPIVLTESCQSILGVNGNISLDEFAKFNLESGYDFKELMLSTTSGGSFDVELKVRNGRNQLKYLRICGKFNKDDQSVIGFVHDVSIVKITQKRLVQKDGELVQYMSLLNNFSLVVKVNEQGHIIFCNEEFCKVTGLDRQTILSVKKNIVLDAIFTSKPFANIWPEVKKQRSWHGKLKIVKVDSTGIWLDVTLSPNKSRLESMEYILICRDVSADEKMHQENIELMKLASLGEASSQIMHDVMNPLAQIQGCEYMLSRIKTADEKDSAVIDDVRQSINKNIDRIKSIFQDMRSVLMDDVEYKKGDIAAVIEKGIQTLQPLTEKFSVKISFDPNDSYIVMLNEGLMIQTVVNVLKNSIEAIKDEDDQWISIQLAAESGKLFIRVIDSGHGIPKAIQDHMFDPLFSTKAGQGGTGIGMAISKKVMELHSGDIRVNDECEHTEIDLILPLAS